MYQTACRLHPSRRCQQVGAPTPRLGRQLLRHTHRCLLNARQCCGRPCRQTTTANARLAVSLLQFRTTCQQPTIWILARCVADDSRRSRHTLRHEHRGVGQCGQHAANQLVAVDQSSTKSTSISTPSRTAAARTTARMLIAVRPRRPITRPKSPSPTRTSSRILSPSGKPSTLTASGLSTMERTT